MENGNNLTVFPPWGYANGNGEPGGEGPEPTCKCGPSDARLFRKQTEMCTFYVFICVFVHVGDSFVHVSAQLAEVRRESLFPLDLELPRL